MTHFLNISDFNSAQLVAFLDLADQLKADLKAGKQSSALAGKTLGMIFQKPSNRTRISFEVGMAQLGGRAIYIRDEEVGLGAREPVRDVARVLSRYLDGVVIRSNTHDDIDVFSQFSSVPVINGLSDMSHPCQALADMMTIREHKGTLEGVKLCYLGDVNNVCASLMTAAQLLGVEMTVACPPQSVPIRDVFSGIRFVDDPRLAIKGADVVYTDVWVSMGQEDQAQDKLDLFRPYQVDLDLMSHASEEVIFMHCLPAHRGDEVTDDVMESSMSVVFDQAENRLHAQKAILMSLLK
jgi:ornithine carbamoyltransferase